MSYNYYNEDRASPINNTAAQNHAAINAFAQVQDHLSSYRPISAIRDRRPQSVVSSTHLRRNDTLAPHDSVSQIGVAPSTVDRFSGSNYMTRDPYTDRSTQSQHAYYSSQHYLPEQAEEDYEREPASLPLVHYAAKPGHASHSSLGGEKDDYYKTHIREDSIPRYDTAEEDPFTNRYPPPDNEKAVNDLSKQNSERPPIWQRLIRDTTPIEQRIQNHKRGIGVQQRPWLCWILSVGMIAAMIAELGQNWRFLGTPIAIKPIFNYMIGPSSNVLIYTGARFTPCIKNIPDLTNQNFACLNNTASIPTFVCTLSDICGFGGFPNGEPNQSFRFILPIFLHAGIIHIFFNLLVQNTASAQVEREMGSLRFAILYFCSGIFGFILGGNFALVGQASVGASGAIYGTEAAVLVDLIAHWSIERSPKKKLLFLIIELIVGFGIGFIPNVIDNFSHIGGFACGLLIAILLYPAIHQTKRHRIVFYILRAIALPGVILLFVLLTRNFYTSDPNKECEWCRYLSCWPTAANNHCKGTGLTETNINTGQSFSITSVLVLLGGAYLRSHV